MHAAISAKDQDARVRALKAEIESLRKTLGNFHIQHLREGEDADQIVKTHIKLLHRYNEAKDATQILIGRLATVKETTIRQIHDDLGLDGAD